MALSDRLLLWNRRSDDTSPSDTRAISDRVRSKLPRCFATNAIRATHCCFPFRLLDVCLYYSNKCSSLSTKNVFLCNKINLNGSDNRFGWLFTNIVIYYSYYRNNAYGFINKKTVVICVANEGLGLYIGGIIVCTFNVRLLVQYVSRLVVMCTREMML